MSRTRRDAAGFTMIELVTVMAIAAILAAFAFSRINVASFDTEGFANQAAAMVRYAQKTAISQRRTVAVVVTAGNPGTLKLCYTDMACSGGDVREPPGTGTFQHTSRVGVAVGGTVGAGFTFNALGKPFDSGGIAFSASKNITASGGDIAPITITIEAETGYVR